MCSITVSMNGMFTAGVHLNRYLFESCPVTTGNNAKAKCFSFESYLNLLNIHYPFSMSKSTTFPHKGAHPAPA